MGGAVFSALAAFLTQLAAGAGLATAFRVAVVTAVLTVAASSLIKRPRPPVLELGERTLNVRVPTPTRKILYGQLVIGAAIVDLRVEETTLQGSGDFSPARRPEVHLLNYRDSRINPLGISEDANDFPLIRVFQSVPQNGTDWKPDRAALEAGDNLAEGITVYHTSRRTTIKRNGPKNMEILYALADNPIEVVQVLLGDVPVSGTSVDVNRVTDPDTGRYYYGDIYIRNHDHDVTDTVIKRAQKEGHKLQDDNESMGFVAAFIWDTSGRGNFMDIVEPQGVNWGGDPQYWKAPFRGYVSTDRTFGGPPDYFVGLNQRLLHGATMGNGVALLAASYWGFREAVHSPFPSIPELSVNAWGKVPDDIWSEVRRVINDDTLVIADNNAAACLYAYARLYTDYGTETLGVNRIDEASFRQAIIDCHDLGLNVNAYIDLASRPDDVLSQFALAMRVGDVYDVGGILHATVGKPVAATHTITEDDVLDDWSYVGGLPRDQRPDGINIEYPVLNGVATETITLADEFVRGDGSGITEDLTVAFAATREQALDIGAIHLLRAQESRTLEVRVRAAQSRILPNDTVMVDIPTLFGATAGAQKYRVQSVEPQADLSLALVMREERDQIWRGHDLLNPTDKLLLESGDAILLESGDNILIA